MKKYIKVKLQSIDGVYDKKKEVEIEGAKPKYLTESFVKAENANWKITGVIYKEVK